MTNGFILSGLCPAENYGFKFRLDYFHPESGQWFCHFLVEKPLEFFIPTKPKTVQTQRNRFNPNAKPGQKKSFPGKDATNLKALIAEAVKSQLKEWGYAADQLPYFPKKIEGQDKLGGCLVVLKEKTKDWYPGRPQWIGDTGNYEKSFMDALNGILYSDDSQIHPLFVFKDWGDHPGYHFYVWRIPYGKPVKEKKVKVCKAKKQ